MLRLFIRRITQYLLVVAAIAAVAAALVKKEELKHHMMHTIRYDTLDSVMSYCVMVYRMYMCVFQAC